MKYLKKNLLAHPGDALQVALQHVHAAFQLPQDLFLRRWLQKSINIPLAFNTYNKVFNQLTPER